MSSNDSLFNFESYVRKISTRFNVLYRYPKDDELRKKWVEAIQLVNNDGPECKGLVCSLHFLPAEVKRLSDRSVLLPYVVPSIFDYMVEVDDIDSIDPDKQTDPHSSVMAEKHRINMEKKIEEISALKRKVAGLERQVATYKQKYEKLQQKLSRFFDPKEDIVSAVQLIPAPYK